MRLSPHARIWRPIPMTTLRMGFCGGCLSHQRDIPLNQLFYRILSRRLAEQYGVEVRLVISRHFEARAPERVAQLVKDGIDLLVLHVRTLPAVPNARWIEKEVSGGKARLRLNSRFVMGPPPSTQAGLPGRMVCERLNRAMRRSSALLGFPYVDLFPGWDDGYLMWDGLHLNSGGHRHIAERLRVEIGEGITAVARQREAPSP